MKISAGSSSASILMRRMRRHARLASLWQPPETASALMEEPIRETPTLLSAPQPESPSIGEYFSRAESSSQADKLSSVLPLPPATPLPDPTVEMAPSGHPSASAFQSFPARSAVAGWPAVQIYGEPPSTRPVTIPHAVPSTAVAPVVHPQPALPETPEIPQPSMGEPKEPSSEAADWRRLQNILYAHRQKEASQAASPEGEERNAVQNEVSTQEPNEILAPASDRTSPGLRDQRESMSHDERNVAPDRTSPASLARGVSESAAQWVFVRPEPVDSPSGIEASSASSVDPTSVPGSVVQAKADLPGRIEPSQEDKPDSSLLSTQAEQVSDQTMGQAAPGETLAFNATPLEAAWPVQRRSVESSGENFTALPGARESSDVNQPGPEREPEATDRPLISQPMVAQQAITASELMVTEREALENQPLVAVEGMPGHTVMLAREPEFGNMGAQANNEAAANLTVPAVHPEAESLPPREPRPAVVQESPIVLPHPAHEEGTPEMIPTDIGPLPADLWELVGETPPIQNQAAGKSLSGQMVNPATEVSQEMGEIENSASLSFFKEAGRAAVAQAANVVQAEEIAPEEVAGQNGSTAGGDEEKEGVQPVEPDLSSLVQQVYAEIRRRLAQEWERYRG